MLSAGRAFNRGVRGKEIGSGLSHQVALTKEHKQRGQVTMPSCRIIFMNPVDRPDLATCDALNARCQNQAGQNFSAAKFRNGSLVDS